MMPSRVRFALAVWTFVVLTAGLGAQAADAGAAITAAELRRHLGYIASDELRGRETGSAGQHAAALYLRERLREAGVAPLPGTDDYFSPWVLRVAGDMKAVDLEFRRGEDRGRFRVGSDNRSTRPLELAPTSGEGRAHGEVVFVGYGITAEEYGWDDYAGKDVKGKIVLCLRHEPRERDDRGWNGQTNTVYASFEKKTENAIAHGASAILFVTDPENHGDTARSAESPHGGRRSALAPGEVKATIPALWLDHDTAGRMLGSRDYLSTMQRKIDDAMKPHSETIGGLTIDLSVTIEKTDRPTENVCAFIPGADPLLKNEWVVVGAHYDHVGVKPGLDDDVIMNGADDNGSGTVALLGNAIAFRAANPRPKRSVAFVFFSGEEQGMLGSEYFVAHAPFAPESVAAMINMDMIGRNFDSGAIVIGTQFSPALREIVATAARKSGLKDLSFATGQDNRRELDRSDQASFLAKKIPIAFFTTGLHADYHKPSDEVGAIKFENLGRIARTVLETTIAAADMPNRPTFVPAR